MGTTNFNFNYPAGTDAADFEASAAAMLDDIDSKVPNLLNGTSGTWTPSMTWSTAPSGSWTGTWLRIGSLMLLNAVFTFSATYNPANIPQSIVITGIPVGAAGYSAGTMQLSWGNHIWPLQAASSTLWATSTTKPGSTIPIGSTLAVGAIYVPVS